MKYDRKMEFVARCRAGMSEKGCCACGKVVAQGLFLKGTPQVQIMVRAGASISELKAAMRERGWYCRPCCSKFRRVKGAAGISLQDQFPTQEDYYEYVFQFHGPGKDRSRAPRPADWLANGRGTAAAVTHLDEPSSPLV